MLRILCLFAIVLGAKSALAPFIKPCKFEDNACALSSAQAAVKYVAPGIPELGIKPLDPMFLPVIKGDQAGLQLSFKDSTVTGMKDCVIEALEHDVAKMKQFLTIKCSTVLSGDYSLGGQLLIFPIKGEGKYTIKIRDLIVKTASELKTVKGADGKDHWKIAAWKHLYQVKTGAKFEFQNLFGGNKVLAQPVEEFLNTNWQDVMKEVAPPVVNAIVTEVVNAVDTLYVAVPAEELVIK